VCWEDVMVALCPFWDPPLIIGHSEEDKLIAESLPSPSKKANRGTRWPRAAAAVRRATGCGTRPVSRASPPMNPAGSSGAMLIDRAASVSELRSGPRRRRHVGPPRARSVPGELTKRGGRPEGRAGRLRTRLGREGSPGTQTLICSRRHQGPSNHRPADSEGVTHVRHG